MRHDVQSLTGFLLLCGIAHVHCAPQAPSSPYSIHMGTTQCWGTTTTSWYKSDMVTSKSIIEAAIQEICNHANLTLTEQTQKREWKYYGVPMYDIKSIGAATDLNNYDADITKRRRGVLTLVYGHDQGNAFTCDGTKSIKLKPTECTDAFNASKENCDIVSNVNKRGGLTPYRCGVSLTIMVAEDVNFYLTSSSTPAASSTPAPIASSTGK